LSSSFLVIIKFRFGVSICSTVVGSLTFIFCFSISDFFLINMFYQNVRGLLTKIPYLRNALLNVNYDIICLNETWLNSNVFDAELGFNNYNL